MNTHRCTVPQSLDRAPAPAVFGHAGGIKTAVERRDTAGKNTNMMHPNRMPACVVRVVGRLDRLLAALQDATLFRPIPFPFLG